MYLTFLQQLRDFVSRYTAVGMQERALAELVAGNCVMTPVEEPHFEEGALSPRDQDDDDEELNKQALKESKTVNPKKDQPVIEEPTQVVTPVKLPKPPSY